MKRIKKDNQGFTLVELLIAIVVIAIVFLPLYGNFRQSTYLNGKAKNAMDATNMASNVMEGLSAYTPEEIILGFYSNDSVSGNIAGRNNTLNIMPNEVTVEEYGDLTKDGSGNYHKGFVTSNLTLGAGSYNYAGANYAEALGGVAPEPSMKYLKVKESADKKYYFYAQGVQQARGTYDVIVELDASAETGFSGDTNSNGKIDSGSETVGYNDYESAQITNINPLFDGVYTENASQKANAAAALLTKKTNSWLNMLPSDFYPVLTRELTVNISKDSLTGYALITVDEEYSVNKSGFSTASGNWVNLSSDFAGQTMIYSLPTTTVFDGSVYKQDPREIYIYYNGNYNSTNSAFGSSLDSFVIKNPDKVPVNIHLIRIKSSETTDSLEAGYRCNLAIEEPGTDFVTDIYSNLRDNVTMTSTQNETNRNDFSRCLVKINGNTIMSATSSHIDDYNEIVHENGGVRTEVEDRVYAVKMYVYNEGAAAAGFPESMKITEFDGSSLQ